MFPRSFSFWGGVLAVGSGILELGKSKALYVVCDVKFETST